MSTINANSPTEQQYKKPGFLTNAGAVIIGGAATQIPVIPALILIPKIMQKMKGISCLTEDEYTKLSLGVNKTLKESGLRNKGVEILKSIPGNEQKILKIMEQDCNAEFKFFPKKIKNFYAKLYYKKVYKGENAFYIPIVKKIIMPAKELALVTFHEMGHAINANISKTGQFARKFLPLGKLSTPIALIALFKTKKAPNEEPQGVIDKTTDFIKNNAGKLMFLTFLPRLTEEATASIRGGNWAKKVLDSSLAQKVSTTNKLAYMTYLSAALGVSAGIALGVKVKDAIAKPKPIN